MSIKDLFNNYKSNQFRPSESELSSSKLVESNEFIVNKTVEKNRYVPPIDFSTASNFAKFGSSELYYEYAFKRIYQQYPYDGTLAEQQEFQNSSTFLDKYIFDHVYPRTAGHIKFSSEGWGNRVGAFDQGYGLSDNIQYISVLGGPHTASGGMLGKELSSTFENSMIYDESKSRAGSFEWSPASGSTIEFWLKKKAFDNSDTIFEAILDIWNGEVTSSDSYGRITLSLANLTGYDPIYLTMKSGSTGFVNLSIATGSLVSEDITDDKWHHYAVSIENINSTTSIDLYRDGKYIKNTTTGNTIGSIKNVTGGVNAFIGALQSPISSSIGVMSGVGWGKLSASLDEFRYWKKKRTTNEIGEFWFTNLGGGTNKREYNTDLGVYFKFNEGITGITSTDDNILDYSGRISNGVFVGYTGSARSTESALESLTNVEEFKDPIIYSFHPTVSSSLAEHKLSGSVQDFENTSLLYHLFPSWIIEEDTENGQQLRFLTQIMASYFDTLNAQIGALTDFKAKRYFSGSLEPNAYAREILRGQGFVVPDLFIEADILEELRSKDDNETYDKDIQKVKNLIYQNIYNNLNYINKSKGTEKSFRNLFRCFGVDSELLKLNLYSDGSTYLLKDNYEFTSFAKPVLNLNKETQITSSVYQSQSAPDGNGITYISGSETNGERFTGITLECEAIFPYKFKKYETGYFPTNFKTASIAGFHRAKQSHSDLAWHSSDVTLSILAVKKEVDSTDVTFKLSGSAGGTDIDLTSSLFSNIYDNNKWILAARVRHESYPYAGAMTASANSGNYIVEFHGVNSVANDVKNEFTVSASVTNSVGISLLNSRKRLYAGAHNFGYTGSTVDPTDVKISQVRYWQSYLNNEEIKEHSFDPTNYGLTHPYRSDNPFQLDGASGIPSVPKIETLALHWDFMTVTSSDSNGRFFVNDISSGSVYNHSNFYNVIGNIVQNKHDGYGVDFEPNSVDIVDKEFIYSAKKRLVDEVYSSDGVTIKNDKTENFFEDNDVSDHFYSFEKSPYNAVSQQMINFFGSMKDFNSLIGDPAERYRPEYKQMTDLKRLFFRKVENTPDPERFFEYFKWIDTSISFAIKQLIPASSRFSEDVKDVVESHILERNKFQEKFPLTAQQRATEGVIKSFSEMFYNWKFGHAPLDGSDNKNCLWQKTRRRVEDSNVQTLRDNIYKTSNTKLTRLYDFETEQVYLGATDAVRRLTRPYKIDLELKQSIHGGTNYYVAKNRDYALEVVHPHGEVTSDGIPKNVLVVGVGSGQGLTAQTICEDEEELNQKEKYNFTGVDGRFSTNQINAPVSEFAGYKHFTKGIATFPFNLMSQSSNVTTGYQKQITENFESSVYLTNLHSDTVDRSNEVPMQGPFTERHVGGHQSRHISINKYDTTLRDDETGNAPENNLHNQYTRPEAYRILLGENPNNAIVDGALGMTPPDYGVTTGSGIYPDIAKKRASYYREEKAKRPVNIKNIKHRESGSVAGNYKNNYEFLMLQGRRENNLYFRDNPDITNYLPVQYTSSLPHTTHVMSLVGIDPVFNGNVFGKHTNNMQPDGQLISAEVSGTPASGSFSVSGSTINGVASSGSIRLNRQIVAATPARFSFDVSGSHYAGTKASGSFSFTRTTTPAVSASIQFTAKGRTIEQVESSGSFVVTASHVAGTSASGSFVVRRPPYYSKAMGSFRVKSKDFLSEGHTLTITQNPGGTPVVDVFEIDVNNNGSVSNIPITTGSSNTDFYNNFRSAITLNTVYTTTAYSETAPTFGTGIWANEFMTDGTLLGNFGTAHPWKNVLSAWSCAFWLYVSSSNNTSGYIFTEHAAPSFNSSYVRNLTIDRFFNLTYRKSFETAASTNYVEWSSSIAPSNRDRWIHVTVAQSPAASSTGAGTVPSVKMYLDGSEATISSTFGVDLSTNTGIPTSSGGFNLYAPGDGVNPSIKGGLDEFGIWDVELNNVDNLTLNNGGLYIARTAVSSSRLEAWWRFEHNFGAGSAFDMDGDRAFTTGDLLEEQQNDYHLTASFPGTKMYVYTPTIFETEGYATFNVQTNNTGSEHTGSISNSGASFSNLSDITLQTVTSTASTVRDASTIVIDGVTFELDDNSSVTGGNTAVAFSLNQNKTDFWNILSQSIKDNTVYDTITITDNGNTAAFSLTSSTIGPGLNVSITGTGTSFSSLSGMAGGSNASGATDGHAITIDGVRFELDADGLGVSSGQDIDCGAGTTNSSFWNSLSASIKTNTEFDTITITDNGNGTATFSLTASTGGDSNNGVISTSGASFPSFVQTAGGVDASGSTEASFIEFTVANSEDYRFHVDNDGGNVDGTPTRNFYVTASTSTDVEWWNNLSQSIKDRGFGVSYTGGGGEATFTVTTFKTGSSGNTFSSNTSATSHTAFNFVLQSALTASGQNRFHFVGGSDTGDGNEGHKIAVDGSTFEMDSNGSVTAGNISVASSGSLTADQVFNNLTASIKANTDFDTISITGTGNTRTISLTSSVVGAAKNGLISGSTGNFGSIVNSAGGTDISGSQYGDRLVIGNHGSDVAIIVGNGSSPDASLSNTNWWNDLSQSIKTSTRYSTITIIDNGSFATFQLTSSVAEEAGNDTHGETGTTFFNLVNSTGGSDVGDSSDGSAITIEGKVFVLDSDGSFSGDYVVASSGSLSNDQVFNALTQSIKDNTVFDTITMTPPTGNNRILSLTSSVTGSDKNSALGSPSGDFTVLSNTAGGTFESGSADGDTITIGGKVFELDNNSSVTGTNVSVNCSDSLTNTQFWNTLSASIKAQTVFDIITYSDTAGIATFQLTSSTTGSALNVAISETGKSFSVINGMVSGSDRILAVFTPNDVVLAVPTPTLRNGDRNKTIISSRFAAPGGVEIESNAYLDIYARELSVHNALPFRNLTVRGSGSGEANQIRVNDHLGKRRGLNSLLALHSGQFGIDSEYGSIVAATYSTSGSFNKQHRNRSRRMESGSASVITGSLFDNAFVSSPIPRSEFQYSWIDSAISGSNWEAGQRILGYQDPEGVVIERTVATGNISLAYLSGETTTIYDTHTFTITINDGTTSVTFELTKTHTVSAGNVAVTANSGFGTASSLMLVPLRNAINNSALRIVASSGAGSTIDLTHEVPGASGNIPIVATSTNTGQQLSQHIEGMSNAETNVLEAIVFPSSSNIT